MYGSFLKAEFNYTSFLNRADHSAEKYVPFLDTSNDTYFKSPQKPIRKLYKNQNGRSTRLIEKQTLDASERNKRRIRQLCYIEVWILQRT
ncbi:hypothetical protein CAEBREN_30613 [Caenorhabditis brenneri]|uniref:Uncharacterized protein n=1 Tax=Caenorhabditis brenneri TaxID=135651 RepID=G0P3D1_CAEBE|nr:hypothetical protein CAEBREN_30613 [Caenorhabditis brenneri]